MNALPPTYIRSLDGWRAIAVLCVMAMHDQVYRIGSVSDSWLSEHGGLGVRVFFSISGVLICSRLLDEETRNGTINLRDFYLRRGFRILPPAVLYLLIAAVFIAGGHSQEAWHLWWASLLFCRNFFHVGDSLSEGWITAHYWSLSLEEQFYLLLPALLVFAGRWRTRLLGTLILCCFLWSAYVAHRLTNVPLYRPDIALNVLFVPAFVAILLNKQKFAKVIAAVARPWPLYLLLIYLSQSPELSLRAGLTYHGHFYDQLVTVFMTALVLSTALHPTIWLSRVLELAPLRWIGRISYSLYLWQQLFLTEHFAPAETIGWIHHFHLGLPMTFLCASLSYYLLERPMIRLGHIFTKRPLPGRPEDFDPPTSQSQTAAV